MLGLFEEELGVGEEELELGLFGFQGGLLVLVLGGLDL